MTVTKDVGMCNSRYNVGYEEGSDLMLFNTRTCGFLKLSDTSLENYKWLLAEQSKPIPTEISESPSLSSLRQGGFIVPADYDELEAIRHKSRVSHSYSSKYCSLTVAPTLHCNMKCKYCFEHVKPTASMSKKVQDQLIAHIKNKIMQGSESVSITWFGGEPLIGMSAIEYISKKVIALCRRHKVKYSASMITNGTLLNQRRAVLLKKLKVGTVQITLDGPPEIHDTRRPYLNGMGTFDIILKNIKNTLHLFNISIRCNIDADNMSSAESLAKLLNEQGLAPYLRLYYAPVHKGLQGCGDAAKGCHALYSQKEFAVYEAELKKIVAQYGFRNVDLIRPAHSSCGATFSDIFVVDPVGHLHKCNETIGMDEDAVGTLSGGVQYNNKYFKWCNFEAFSFEKCRKCKVLPMCMGWCPAKVMEDDKEESCFSIRYNLIEELKLLHSQMKIDKDKKQVCAA